MWQVIFSMPEFAVKAAERVPGNLTGNLTNCFELCSSTKYLWREIACQRSANDF